MRLLGGWDSKKALAPPPHTWIVHHPGFAGSKACFVLQKFRSYVYIYAFPVYLRIQRDPLRIS